jgi:UDP-2-acetamido-3-amino-2,3-dideoxy-glucuronate N-acetyltransferase
MREQQIRVGVVGAGYWGPNLIRNLAELGLLDSVCDVNAGALESIRRLYPDVATTTEMGTLLARPIDAVVIATPAQFHSAMCLSAIAAGKHVFVEKPLALNIQEGKQIAGAAQAANVVVFVGHLLLYHPAVKKMRSLIAEGVIGNVWHVRSRRLSLGKLRSHENVWWSFAPHDIALMLTIMGEEPRGVVAAQTCARGVDISDMVYADFEFSAGRSAHIEVCWLDPEKSARLDVFGTKGVLTLTDSRKGCSLVLKPIMVSNDDQNLPIAVRGEEQHVDFDTTEPLRNEILAFAESVRTGKPAETDAQQGIAVLRTLAMAHEAIGGHVEIGAMA